MEISLTTNLKLLSDAHQLTSEIEEEILNHTLNIHKILIHYEPQHKDIELIAVPLDVKAPNLPDEKSRLSDHFGEAPYFAIIAKSYSNKTVSIDNYLPNCFKDLERQKGVKAAEMLAEHGVDQVRSRVRLEGKGSGYALDALQIEVAQTSAQTLEDMITELKQDFVTSA